MTDSGTGDFLVVEGLTKIYRARQILRRRAEDDVLAVDQVSLRTDRGTTLGVVGESGSGKTTLARLTAGLLDPTAGRIVLDKADLAGLPRRELHRRVQYVFQDPYSALNPRRTIRWSVEVPLRYLAGLDRRSRRQRVHDLLDRTGLRPELADRYPHQLSGGQRQRVVIARALAAEPELLVLDEPVSALDVSIQAQILTLLRELQGDLGLTYLFISHDLAVVENLSRDVIVMNRGVVVERGACDEVFRAPQQEYTQRLVADVPGSRGRRRAARRGEPETQTSRPTGGEQ